MSSFTGIYSILFRVSGHPGQFQFEGAPERVKMAYPQWMLSADYPKRDIRCAFHPFVCFGIDVMRFNGTSAIRYPTTVLRLMAYGVPLIVDNTRRVNLRQRFTLCVGHSRFFLPPQRWLDVVTTLFELLTAATGAGIIAAHGRPAGSYRWCEDWRSAICSLVAVIRPTLCPASDE